MNSLYRILLCVCTTAIMILVLFMPIQKQATTEAILPVARAATISLVDRRPVITSSHTEAAQPKSEEYTIPILETPVQEETYSQVINKEEEEIPLQTESLAASVKAEEIMPHLIDGYYSSESVTQAPIFDRALLASRIIYPPMAKRQGREGLVILRLFISETGHIDRIVVEQDPGYGFAEAAVKAFRSIQVQSARRAEKPVKVTMTYPVRFSLR